ncbi:MAG: TIGR04551 family protein [Deltaproteobacteria bacterium]|nr:MAG: TIGR04551 family protein [Deltaproteobacteria bacterium]
MNKMIRFVTYLSLGLTFLLAPYASWAANENAGALSDPAGEGRPHYKDDAKTTDLSIKFHIHGYYRMRWSLLHQLDLNRGPTPSTGQPIFPVAPSKQGPLNTADMRLRLDMSLEVARSVRVVVRIDALDNLVLGSTPLGLPRTGQVPSIIGTNSQDSPSQGENAFLDAIKLRWAYGEVLLPIGYLAAGRMGSLTPWGLGVLVQSGNDLDADFSDAGDRVVLGLALFHHLLILAYDFSASGPIIGTQSGTYLDQDPRDDVRSFAVAFARYDTKEGIRRKLKAGYTVVNYGLLFSYRYQDLDVPTYYEGAPENKAVSSSELVERNAWSFVLSLWFLLRTAWVRVELEAVYGQGEIGNSSLLPGVRLTEPLTSQQFGGALQVAVAPPAGRWGVGVELGLASGDDAPGFGVGAASPNQANTQAGDIDGPQINYPRDRTANNFRFHPSYRVDQIFWRRIIGQVTDALYVKAAAHVDLTRRLRLWTSGLYSRTLHATTAPGNDNNLGIEWDTGLRYNFDPGFEVRFTFAVFFPFAGLRNVQLQLDPEPAIATHLVLGYLF